MGGGAEGFGQNYWTEAGKRFFAASGCQRIKFLATNGLGMVESLLDLMEGCCSRSVAHLGHARARRGEARRSWCRAG
eukprot:2415899-Rhodomonas_salina.2